MKPYFDIRLNAQCGQDEGRHHATCPGRKRMWTGPMAGKGDWYWERCECEECDHGKQEGDDE